MRASDRLFRILAVGAFFAPGVVLAQTPAPTDPALQAGDVRVDFALGVGELPQS